MPWLLSLLICFFSTFLANPAWAAPSLNAKSAILIDGETGQILFGLNPHAHRPPASTTKVMSSLIALSHGRLDDVVSVSDRAAGLEGSSIYLESGEKLTLEQLLYGVLLESGNDASAAVAEHIGGSEEQFVAMMNEKARELELHDSHFTNPHGLPMKDHYSSAYDLARIAREALRNPEFALITGTRVKEIPGNDKIKVRLLNNHNKLLRYFPGATGGKTGFTMEAGRCFVGSARRNGRFVIEVILDSPTLWQDAEKLLNYGLDEFDSFPVAAGGSVFGEVKVRGGLRGKVGGMVDFPLTVSVPKGQVPDITTRFQLPEAVEAPLKKDQTIGSFTIFNHNISVAVIPLKADQASPLVPPIWQLFTGAIEWFLRGGLLALAAFSLFHLHATQRKRRLKARIQPRLAVVSKPRRPRRKPRGLVQRLSAFF